MSPEGVSVYVQGQGSTRRTKDDLATVQYTDELVPGRLVVVDLQQLYRQSGIRLM